MPSSKSWGFPLRSKVTVVGAGAALALRTISKSQTLAVITATVLTMPKRGRGLYRTVYFIPTMVPSRVSPSSQY